MYDCPHCRKPAISFRQKLLMGPPHVNRCPACGREFAASRLSWLNGILCAALMLFIIFAWIVDTTAGWRTYTLLVIPYAGMAVVHMKWIKLIRK